MRYLYTAAVLTVLYPVFGTLTIQGAAGYFGGICVSVAAAVLMRHALGGIESILGRREVTDERIVTIALLAGVVVMAFGKFELFGISPGAVAAAVFCMLAAYSKGIAAVSCAAAAAVGRVMGCGGDLVFVAVLCSCTLLCCCLRVFGKWGIGGGFTAASIVFAVLIPGAGKLNIAETLIAAAAFLAVPDDFFEKLDANRPGYRDGKYEQRLSAVTYKLNSLADVLGQMAKLFEPNGSGEQAAADGFVNRQLAGVANCIKKLALVLFRPPHGHMFANQYLTLKRTYKIVMWDLVTRDYSKKLRGPQVLANVMRYARNGSIITFHDSLKSWCNGNLQYALPRAIDFLKEEGYEFKVL